MARHTEKDAAPLTPDAIERMLAGLPREPDFGDVDRVLEHAGDVLDVLEAAYQSQLSSWLPNRRYMADRCIHEAFAAVNNAILALVVDRDVEGAVEAIAVALPILRRAWAVQTLTAV